MNFMNNNVFQLTFPDNDWRETTTYTFEGPHDNGIRHNLVLVIIDNIPKKTVLNDYAKGQCDAATHHLPGFEYIQEKETILANGIKSYEIIFKYVPTDRFPRFQKQWYLLIENKAYIFSSTFTKKTLNTIAHDVGNIVESLLTKIDIH